MGLVASFAGEAGSYTIIVIVVYSTGETIRYRVALTISQSPSASLWQDLLNTGPPVFQQSLDKQIVYPGNHTVYSLPSIFDQDNDTWTIVVELGSTVPFA